MEEAQWEAEFRKHDTPEVASKRITDFIHAEPGVEIIQFPPAEQLFPAPDDLSKFADLPPRSQKYAGILAECCRNYMSGFLLLDDRTPDERDEWEASMLATHGAAFAEAYRWSKLRPNAMQHILMPLTQIIDSFRNVSVETETIRSMRALLQRIPKPLLSASQRLLLHPELESSGEVILPYTQLSREEKLKVVAGMDDLAAHFLRLVAPVKETEILKVA